MGWRRVLVHVPKATAQQCRNTCDAIIVACQNQPFHFKGEQIDITVSIGATMFNQFNLDTHIRLLQRADQGLYNAKANGKKQYVFNH